MTIAGTNYDAIILPDVVTYAKKYFNCPTLAGVPLESDGQVGTKGSHWEKLFIPNEYMNPTIENPGVLSGFTGAVLQASNWYTVLEGFAQPYDWAKNDGCGHFEFTTCPSGREYCSAGDVDKSFCSVDYMAKAACSSISEFLQTCNIIRAVPDTFCAKEPVPAREKSELETYGSHSRCIEWSKKDDEDPTRRYP